MEKVIFDIDPVGRIDILQWEILKISAGAQKVVEWRD